MSLEPVFLKYVCHFNSQLVVYLILDISLPCTSKKKTLKQVRGDFYDIQELLSGPGILIWTENLRSVCAEQVCWQKSRFTSDDRGYFTDG